MMKLILACVVAVVVLISIASIILLVMNWGEKVTAPIISFFLVGSLTTFTTIYFKLNESKEEMNFTTSCPGGGS